MPLQRKLIQSGTSKVVTIPPSWIRHQEKKLGRKVDSLLMELNNKIELFVEERE